MLLLSPASCQAAPSPWVSLPRCLSPRPGEDSRGGSACAMGMVALSAAWGQRWGGSPCRVGDPWAWAGRWEPPRVRRSTSACVSAPGCAWPPAMEAAGVCGRRSSTLLLQGASVRCQRQERKFLASPLGSDALLQPLPSHVLRTKHSPCLQSPQVQEMLVLGGWWGPVYGVAGGARLLGGRSGVTLGSVFTARAGELSEMDHCQGLSRGWVLA